jgi:hypothetical protein
MVEEPDELHRRAVDRQYMTQLRVDFTRQVHLIYDSCESCPCVIHSYARVQLASAMSDNGERLPTCCASTSPN